jgi:hypothetical protein
MIRPMRPAQAGSPKHGPKHDHRQREENARNLKPHNPAHPAKRLEESPDPASRSARSLSRSPARKLPRRTGLCSTGGGSRSRLAGRGLGAGGHALAGNASGNAKSNTQSPANGLRIHFDLMVTARLPVPLFYKPSPDAGCSQAALEVR